MNAIRSEKTESTEEDGNLAAVSEVEAGIRDFVRNDIAYLRRPAPGLPSSAENALEPNTEATVNNVNSLIQRVAGTSLAEIENLISELESLRDLLHAEGQRVQREISGYAQLSQAAMKSTRMIAEMSRSGSAPRTGFATADQLSFQRFFQALFPPPS